MERPSGEFHIPETYTNHHSHEENSHRKKDNVQEIGAPMMHMKQVKPSIDCQAMKLWNELSEVQNIHSRNAIVRR